MFQSDSDVDILRTPCQHVRDLFDHSGEAHDFSGERAAVCDHVLDVIAGKAKTVPADAAVPIVAARVATDSHRRIVVTEPSTRTVHILDFANKKYKRIDGAKDNRMLFPYGVALDADDNIYITDLKLGMIVVYSADGKFKKYIGNFKGEGAFDRPTSIAIDQASGRIYLTDTPRHLLFIMDRDGKILAHIGKRGGGSSPSEFRLPTEIALHGKELFVLDSLNERIQVFDLEGHYEREFKPSGLNPRSAKGMAIDAQGLIYFLCDTDIVEVFNPAGERLFRFGSYGAAQGQFMRTQGIYIDFGDRVYVTDTGNRRVQIFQIANGSKTASR
jgi:DNA-binding beta-propeller fold protein YncE